MSQNLSSAAVVIGALLRVNNLRANFFMICVFRYQAQSGFDLFLLIFSFQLSFSKLFFSKNFFRNTIGMSNMFVCKCHQQMTKVAASKEFLIYRGKIQDLVHLCSYINDFPVIQFSII